MLDAINFKLHFPAVCEYLSENLRGRWSDLGRALGCGNLVTELFREPSIRKKDKIYQVSGHLHLY